YLTRYRSLADRSRGASRTARPPLPLAWLVKGIRMSNCAFPAARAAMSRVVAPGLLLLLGMVSPASAQLWTLPPPVKLMDISVRGIDAAYDPVHDVILGVGAFGSVYGTFANSAGEPIGSPFAISSG